MAKSKAKTYGRDRNQPVKIIGRPTIVTQEIVAKLEYAFSIGSTDAEACSFAGISKNTLYDFEKKYPDFSNRKSDLKNNPVFKARQTLVRNLDNPLFAFKYLERKKADEFGDKLKLTDGDGQPLALTQNNLTIAIENAEPKTKQQIIDGLRQLIAGRRQGDALPLQPASPD